MGVTKKPAVKAKTARKVKLNASEVAFAKLQGFPLSDAAKAKIPKRGRPVGSKNKPKTLDKLPVGTKLEADEFYKRLENTKKAVDWEKLAKQLQEALASEMKENEALKSIVADFKAVIRTDSSFTFWDRLVFLFSGKV